MYTYQTKIKLHETDAAGVLFFSNLFTLIHDAYEQLLDSVGFGFAELFREKSFSLPIVHAEADYKAPISVGNHIEIQVKIAAVGETSFTLAYNLCNDAQNLIATAQTVHVAIDNKTRKKIPLPADLRAKIQNFYAKDH